MAVGNLSESLCEVYVYLRHTRNMYEGVPLYPSNYRQRRPTAMQRCCGASPKKGLELFY